MKNIEELNRSPWSGHSALAGYVDRDWQDRQYVLSFFGTAPEARKNYMVIVHRRVAEDAKRMNIFLSADPRGIGSPCGIPHRGFRLTEEIPRGKHFTPME